MDSSLILASIILANTVAISHAIIIIAFYIGLIAAIFKRKWRHFQILIMGIAVLMWHIFQRCPLTWWELNLRQAEGQDTTVMEHLGYIDYYLTKWQVMPLDSILNNVTYTFIAIFAVLEIIYFVSLKVKRGEI